jgi:hypothetical protein
MLQRHGVPVAVAMVLMRHGDPRLTLQTYVDGSKLPVAKAMSELDWLGKGRTEIRTEPDVFCGPSASRDVTSTETACCAGTLVNTAFAANLSQNVALYPEPRKAASLGLEPRQAESESAVLPITPRGKKPER